MQKSKTVKDARNKTHDDDINCGWLSSSQIRAAQGARSKVSDRGSGFGGSRPRGADARATGFAAVGGRAAGARWVVVLEVDAGARKRTAGAHGICAGHGKNGGPGAAAWRSGLPCKRIRIGRTAAARGQFGEAFDT